MNDQADRVHQALIALFMYQSAYDASRALYLRYTSLVRRLTLAESRTGALIGRKQNGRRSVRILTPVAMEYIRETIIDGTELRPGPQFLARFEGRR